MTRLDIAVASGKGGTGKTTVSVSLSMYLSRNGKSTTLLDCDVEEPNANLFLGAPVAETERVSVPVPLVREEACTGCGRCEDVCAYNAIVLIKGKPLVLPDMCHSCGGCFLACPERAITEIGKEIGSIESGSAGGIRYAGGRLDIGEAMSPPLIRAVKRRLYAAEVRIFDCPPGTSCPVVEAVRGCDFLLLVTEPTPFGLNDLALAVELARALKLPFGALVNRAGGPFRGVDDYCAAEGVPVLACIPESRAIAESYARGDCASFILEHHGNALASVWAHIERHARGRACAS